MIQIGNKILSLEIFEVHFVCPPAICLGSCCVYGDSGAPLEDEESLLLEKEFENIMTYISPEGLASIKRQGVWEIDDDGEKVTPLINGHECAYAIFDEGVARCCIEIAYNKKLINFQKPRSCHLYPIRVAKLGEYSALNYHRWHICEAAREKGEKEGIPVFRFLREAVIRVWGNAFYNELEDVYMQMLKK